MHDLGSTRFGWRAALGTGVTTLVTFAIAIATPPLSGQLCKERCFTYPYLEIASRFPRDYFWMFPAFLATLFYVAFMLSLQARARPDRHLTAQLGVALAIMAVLTLLCDYVIQLTVIQPSVLTGKLMASPCRNPARAQAGRSRLTACGCAAGCRGRAADDLMI